MQALIAVLPVLPAPPAPTVTVKAPDGKYVVGKSK
jgi:hypothetical protein